MEALKRSEQSTNTPQDKALDFLLSKTAPAKEDWSPGHPEVVTQSPTLDDRTSGHPVTQSPSWQGELNYPSRRTRERLTVRLPKHKLEKYKLYAHMTHEDMQDLVEYGLDWVTGLLDTQSPRHPNTQSPTNHDLNDLDDGLKDDVIIFYQKVTGNRWRIPEDQEAYKEVAQYAPHIIKQGIAISKMRAKQKINSFRYCHGAIHESAHANNGADYLQYLLWKLKQA